MNLPYDVPANQFMNLEGQKISGSRNWAVWGLDFLTRYDPDALRYYLTVNMPELRDTDWDWAEFVAHNNNELVATWGNLANRVLSFAYKHWDGQIPTPHSLRPADREILATIETGVASVGAQLDAVRLRAALGEAMRLASRSTNTWIPPVRGSRSRPTRPLPAPPFTPPSRPLIPSKCCSLPSCPSLARSCITSWVTPHPCLASSSPKNRPMPSVSIMFCATIPPRLPANGSPASSSLAKSSIRPPRCSRSWRRASQKLRGEDWESR